MPDACFDTFRGRGGSVLDFFQSSLCYPGNRNYLGSARGGGHTLWLALGPRHSCLFLAQSTAAVLIPWGNAYSLGSRGAGGFRSDSVVAFGVLDFQPQRCRGSSGLAINSDKEYYRRAVFSDEA